jgi:membrane protease YdiL (CAAX protease family)
MTSQPAPFQHPGPPPARPELPEGVERPPLPAPAPDPGAGDQLPRWAPWAPFAGLLLTLVIAIAGGTVLVVIAELGGTNVSAGHTPPGITIGGTLIQDVGLILSAIIFARVTAGRPTARQFGLRPVAIGRALGWIVAAYVVFWLLSSVYGAVFHITEQDNLPKELGADESTLNLVAVGILVCLVAPVCEELFFRGFCFTALRRWLGLGGGAVATGVIFGLVHVGSADAVFLPPLALLGFLLCLLYHRTGSLLPCMALHALNNALALAVTQHFSPAGTVALMIASPLAVASLGLLAARSRRLNALPVAA